MPISVPVVPRPATKCVIVGRSRSSSGPVRLVVRPGVGLVAVLVEHHPVRVLGGDLLGDRDGLVGAARRRREDDLRAVHPQQLDPLGRDVLRHHADQPVAAQLGHHGQRDAGVAAGRLEDRVARAGAGRPPRPRGPSTAPARSLMLPVGLRSSSLAQSRTGGALGHVGESRGSPTSGVPPQASSRLSYRAMATSLSAGGAAPPCRSRRPREAERATGHGRQDGHLSPSLSLASSAPRNRTSSSLT